MKSTYTIKNFRAFDEYGSEFFFEPITILTGCNSSGKSSIVKSILLLKSFIDQIRKDFDKEADIDLSSYKLDFSQFPNNTLGRFDRVFNRNSSSKEITFEYSVYSYMISSDVKVQMTFATDEHDVLNNGYLQKVKIFNEDDTVLFSSENGVGNNYNLYAIKDQFIEFYIVETLAHSFCGLYCAAEGLGEKPISEEEYEQQKNDYVSFFKTFERNRVNDIFKFVRFSRFSKSLFDQTKTDLKAAEWCRNSERFFYIPVLDKLQNAGKDSIQSLIDKCDYDQQNEFLELSIKKIIAHFKISELDTFGAYYEAMERNFLCKIISFGRSNPFNVPSISKVSIPTLSDFTFYDGRNETWDPRTTWRIVDNEMVEVPEEEVSQEHIENVQNFEREDLSFVLLYQSLMSLSSSRQEKEQSIHYHNKTDYVTRAIYTKHNMYLSFQMFFKEFVIESLIPEWSENISYVSSSRTPVKRYYAMEMHDEFTVQLQKYFESKRVFFHSKSSHYEPDSFMNKWVKEFGIGNKVDLQFDSEGIGVRIFLQKTEGSQPTLLADEGYGITQLFYVILQIETAIMNAKKVHAHSWVGLSELDGYDPMNFHFASQTIAVEEPEVHLHPKFQSLLADMFNEAYLKYNIHFIIETHSEYMIRKEQVLVAQVDNENHLDKDDISIIYVNSEDVKDEPRVKHIGLCKNGYLDESFGRGFFDEATSLSRDLL